MSRSVPIKVSRYDPDVDDEPYFEEYEVPWEEHMKLLDALKHIQQHEDPSLAFRWNCGEGVCGSDAVRLDGKPVLACKTELTEVHVDRENPLRVEPLQVFPTVKDLVADYSEVFEKAQDLKPHFEGEEPDGEFYEMHEDEVAQAQQMRKCINCMACYDVCHVLRQQMKEYAGPRNLVKVSAMQYHPKDTFDRTELMDSEGNIDLCNVTRCCSNVCPQGINITTDAIIPHKEHAISESGWDIITPIMRKQREIQQRITYGLKGLWNQVRGER